jgi:hypothetical protein
MKAQFLVLLAVLCLGIAAAHKFKPGGNFCDDEKERHDTCKPLVSEDCESCSNSKDSSSSSKSKGGSSENKPDEEEPEESGESGSGCEESGDFEFGSGSGSGSGNCSGSGSGIGSGSGSGIGSGSGSGQPNSGSWEKGEYCFILHIFWQFSLELDIELQIIFQEWINITQIEIVANPELTEYQILVEFYYSLQILFEKHIEIKKHIEFKFVGDWGFVCDLEGLALDIVTVNVEITITQVITIVGGTCPLLDTLEWCKDNATTSEEQQAIQVLIQDITIIIQSSDKLEVKLSKIYKKFLAFFVQYPDLKELIFSGKIEGFAVLQAYFDITAVYWRIDNWEFAVGGSGDGCKLIKGLKDWYTNTSNGHSVSERSDVKGFTDKIDIFFQSNSDKKARIQYVAEQLYEFYILEAWTIEVIYSIKIEGYGTLYQLIYSYIYCQNNGIDGNNFSTTTSSTSTTTTTTTTTTTPTTTTTVPNGNCADVAKVNVVSLNITLLLQAIDDDQKPATGHWNDTLIATFKGYKNKIWVISTNSSSSATTVNKFNAIKSVLTGFTTKADFKAIVHAIFIKTWGTIGQYCGCSM